MIKNPHILLLVLLALQVSIQVRAQSEPTSREQRVLNKLEVFGGPSLSFNYGSKFIENYRDDNITNKRYLKFGYTLGIGLYHSILNYLNLNVRIQFETKGRKTELNTPSNPASNRRLGFKNYTYHYLTLSAAPKISIGKNKRITISCGGYFSRIQSTKGHEKIKDYQGQVFLDDSFKGRFFEDVRNDGSVYSITWSPGLKSFKSYDIGAILSIGYSFLINEKKLITVELFDSYGFYNINKNNPYNQREKNHSVKLLVSYTISR